MTQQPYPPQYPGYPQAPMPQQGYPAPAYPQAPAPQAYPQQYAQPAPAPVQQPLAQGSLDDYYSQPSTGGGGGLKFTGQNNQPLIGQSYVFTVTRPITSGDIQQQTNNQGAPQTWKDGRPKFVMIVPVQLLEPSPNHPDGLARWYVKGATRDELARAMAEAGAPEGPPEAGSVIRVTLTGTRQSGAGMNPAHVFAVQYFRPQGAAPVAPAEAPAQAAPLAPAPAAPSPAAPSPAAGVDPQAYAAPPAPVQYAPAPAHPAPANYAPAPAQQYAPEAYPGQPAVHQQMVPAQQPAAPAPVAQAAPQPQMAVPADFDPAQAQLLAQLTAAKQAAGQ